MNKKAIIFDVDGVIVDSNTLSIKTKIKAFKEFKLNLKEYPPAYRSLSLKHLVKKVNKEFNTNISIEDFITKRESIYESQVKNNLNLFEGVKEILEHLKQNNLLVALATSGTKRKLTANLEAVNLNFEFDSIITADDVQKHKPNPEAYRVSATKLNINPKHCIVVEDSPEGIKAAKLAGMTCIGITNSYNSEELKEADYVIKKIIEIKKIINI